MDVAALRDAIAGELRSNLLPFWRERSIDRARGGFIGEMAADGAVRRDAPKGLVLNARFLWTFSALYRALGESMDLALALRAFDYLEQRFRDHRHGGYRWSLTARGTPLDEVKKAYGQAFCIYALSEICNAIDDESALEAALDVFELLERHARDGAHGGYIEALGADWSATATLRLGDDDMVAAKSMNTHLHMLEAYTGLYRASRDDRVAARLAELLDLFGAHILDLGSRGGAHLRAFFDERWTPLGGGYTYGHDIEAAWLLCEAAGALRDRAKRKRARDWAIRLARSALAEAVGKDGGLAYEGRDGAVVDGRREWWCQAEAVVGFTQAWQLTGEERFAQAAQRAWRFIEAHMVDRAGGEWFWRVGADGAADRTLPKVSEWKCPYHTVRMALEMMRRLDEIAEG